MICIERKQTDNQPKEMQQGAGKKTFEERQNERTGCMIDLIDN
jgi:hypothetical protein